MYVSNPRIMWIFAYAKAGIINNPVQYSYDNAQISFLKKFALERNPALIIFGE